MTWLKEWRRVIVTSTALVLIVGCASWFAQSQAPSDPSDPNSSPVTVYSLSPEGEAVADSAIQGARAGKEIATGVSVYWPPATLIAGILMGAIPVLKKLKKQLSESQTEASHYYTTTASVVAALEELKQTDPEEWKKVKEKLANYVGPNAENIIRAIRGLPAKA